MILLLQVIADKDAPMWKGYMYAGLMFAITLVAVVADHQHLQLVARAGFRLSAVLGLQVRAPRVPCALLLNASMTCTFCGKLTLSTLVHRSTATC